ncbi:MAG: aspartate kinase [Anaerolineae bacterium]|nr:aspartate kinase [Anaerolineae bacterium]
MKTLTMKFGGTSVGSPEAIGNVVNIVADEAAQGNRVVVVVSAMSGVTDALINSVNEAAKGNKWAYLSCSQKLRDRHAEALNLLTDPGRDRDAVLSEVDRLLAQHVELCNAVNTLGEATTRISDAVIAFGERMSSRLVAAALRQQGVKAQAFDASQFVVTNNNFGSAAPLWDVTEANIRQKLLPLLEQGVVPVLTGFIGATSEGQWTTLGRGGSDYSGAIFAAYTDSDELVIWTDVDGVMTTDPRIDKRARVLSSISYTEVGELAFYGAKVLHPKTVQPILRRGIPMRVRNTFNPSFPGTLIEETSAPTNMIIKAVTSVRSVSLMTVSGRGMIGVPGIAGRTFLATAQAGANILVISQASSEQSFCFVVTDERVKAAEQAIRAELSEEIERQDVEDVSVQRDVAVVTVVGSGMRGTYGVAGRVFTVLGENEINVIAIAQGSSECSISFVIDEDKLQKAVVALHDLALEAALV